MQQRRAVPAAEAERGIHALEGHLLWEAEIAEARRAAERFAERFAWATTAQRQDVARAYTDERLEISRWTIDRLAGRSLTMRAEYEQRYQQLKARVCLLAGLAVVLLVIVDGLLTR
jgi:hypothetical protein